MQDHIDNSNLVQLLQNLIRFDTTNPPGNENECITYIEGVLLDVGLESQIFSLKDNRPNLVCRLEGKGEAAPILLYGHADVVTTAGQNWTHPPFGGVIADKCIWGRGALDMKGGLAMMIHAMMQMKINSDIPVGDIVLMVFSDEENSGEYGAKFMVNEHPELFDNIRYALGEVGGFNISLGGKRFYPIQVAEKQTCSIRLKINGPGGHASGIVPENAMKKLGEILRLLEKRRLPMHVTAPVRSMIERIAAEFNFPINKIIKLALNPRFSNLLFSQLGDIGNAFIPMFHNTVNPTIVRGGEKINVIPSEIEVLLDGRMLPGFKPEQMLGELTDLLSIVEGVEIELLAFEPCPSSVNMGLFSLLEGTLKKMDPEAIPIPLMLTAVTDGRHLSNLGIQSYGFTPMQLPDNFNFMKLVHAADERIPVRALEFGAEAIYQALISYAG